MNPSIFQFVQLDLTSGCQVVFCSVFDLRQIRSNPAGALGRPSPRLKPQICLFLLQQLCHNVPFLRQLPNIAKQSPFKNSKKSYSTFERKQLWQFLCLSSPAPYIFTNIVYNWSANKNVLKVSLLIYSPTQLICIKIQKT